MKVMKKNGFKKCFTVWTIIAFAFCLFPMPSNAQAPQYSNALIENRADPHIYKHTDGYYYYTATVPQYDRIILRRATTIQGLASAPETVIWWKHASGEMGAHIWAPEIHYIDGKWYIYFAAGEAEQIWNIRMYALECPDSNPITGNWLEKGRIYTHKETFSLDATTFVHNGTRYLVWAQMDPDSSLFIAKMSSPTSITGTPVLISKPEHDWEIQGHRVNEGAAVIKRNGKIFISYSASATDSNYKMGLLTASDTSNLLNPQSWTKNPTPVFTSNAATSQFGPGHNSFTVSEDGQSDILVYHARNYQHISGEPLYDPNRHTRVQKLYWNADGTPNFGIPAANGITPVRLKSHNNPNHVIRHYDYRARIDTNVTKLADSQFRIVPGLAGTGTISFESANYPGYYLRHYHFELYLAKDDGSSIFKGDASFYERTGLTGSGLSFESYNFAGRYIRHSNNLLYVQAISSDNDRADATFYTD